MEKTFGVFLRLKRIENGLTQKKLADMLFVTESAVSKWERDLSLPDIGMVKELAKILNCTETELINATEDVSGRVNKVLATKYLNLIYRVKLIQIIIYLSAIVTTLIVNVSVNKTISWSFIVLLSILIPASLTLFPIYIRKHKKLYSLIAFYSSINLLCMYLSLCNKDFWFLIVLTSTFIVSSLTIIPLLDIKYRFSIVFISFYVSLVSLLLVCSLYSKGDWFLVSFISVTFGLSVIFLTFIFYSYELPFMNEHKSLLYLIIESILLILLVLIANIFSNYKHFISISLPIILVSITLPWFVILFIRYVKISDYYKASVCFLFAGFYFYFTKQIIDFILGNEFVFFPKINFRNWNGFVDGNVLLIIFLTFIFISLSCFSIEIIKKTSLKNRK